MGRVISILDGTGQPVPQTDPQKDESTPVAGPAPVNMGPRNVTVKDGPLNLRQKMAFEGVEVGGEHLSLFLRAIDSCLQATGSLAVRLVQLMLLGAQKGVRVGPIVAEGLGQINAMRQAAEGMMARVQQGLDPVPTIEVGEAPAGA